MDLIAYQDVPAFLVLEKLFRKIVPQGEASVLLQSDFKGVS